MKSTIISIFIAVLLIGGAVFIGNSGNKSDDQVKNNVTVVEGKQVIEIDAKGGYSPRMTTAKADMPTVIKVKTSGTFDCSSALTIPSIGYKTNLPQSGVTEIEVPAQKVGTNLQGICSMGMYNFSVSFI